MKSLSDYILTHFFMWQKFDASKRFKISKEIVKGNEKKAILFFPYWTGSSDIYQKLAKKMPEYTHIFYDYPNEVYSKNVNVSISYIKEILDDAIRTIKELRTENYSEIILVGSSFGSNIALKLSTMISVEKVILNTLDKNFARSIFDSPAMTILKNKLEKQGLTLQKVEKIYHFISTDFLIKKIKNKNKIKIMIMLSKNDIFCTYNELRTELDEFKKLKIKHHISVNRFFGHIFSIYKNLFFNKKIIDFIKG